MTTINSMIKEYGDQAYHVAVDSAVVAVNFGDTQGAKMFSDIALALRIKGYHQYPKRVIPRKKRKTSFPTEWNAEFAAEITGIKTGRSVADEETEQ